MIQDIDNRVINLQIAHVRRALHSNNSNWMTQLLTLENEMKKRNIVNSKILENINSQLKNVFNYWQKEEGEKIKEGVKVNSLDKDRMVWDFLFHRMLDTRYSPPRHAETPVVDGIIRMLAGKNDFYAKVQLVEVDSPSTSKANEILRREQSLLSKGFFQVKKMLRKSHLQQTKQIELTQLKKK